MGNFLSDSLLLQRMNEEKNMSFLDHLEELRWRLVRIAISILVIATVLFIYQEWIIRTFFIAMVNPNFISFRMMCEWFNVCISKIPVSFQSTTMSGQFSYALMMSIMGGIVLSFPFIFYQIWSFVKPGLKQNERSMASGIVFYVSVLFFLGILFGYFVVAPLTVQFFGSYKITDQIENQFTISSYMSTIISTVFWSGVLFLLPVVTYIFAKLGVITSEFLRKYRKHSIIVVLIIAAAITPPDLISQIIVSIPIMILYEIGILAAVRVEKNRKKKEVS
ncbi:MAG: twin-arginine translocase subunit TatC [Flavobacteriia bacterium]|jgi:sec-independent protein translocase protein TatC|nr:twin-arginine translocase subunit TatC [Cryomorphaceae bacterium]